MAPESLVRLERPDAAEWESTTTEINADSEIPDVTNGQDLTNPVRKKIK